MIFNMNGGGVNLNFKVVGNPQPESAKENTIWINTDVGITGRILSPVEPTSPTDGMVWIFTGDSGGVSFEALKIGDYRFDTIFPIRAKQYVSGEWVDKSAKSYQGGEWVDWFTYLYEVGNVFEELTGGYTSFVEQGGYARVDADGMRFQTVRNQSGYYPSSGLSTVKKIDFTKHKSVTAKGTLTRNGTGSSFWVGLFPNSGGDMSSPVVRSYYEENGDFEFSVDIQNVTGSYYLKVGTMVNRDQGGGTPEATVTKIWLE